MTYRDANKEEHGIICKQVRSESIFNVCLLAPLIALMFLIIPIALYAYKKENYDRMTIIVSTTIIALLVIAISLVMFFLLKGFISRIQYINKRQYKVADCVVTDRDLQRTPKHISCFVTVRASDGTSLRIFVPAKIYKLAENGKRALAVMYDEPEGKKKKLPLEVAVL